MSNVPKLRFSEFTEPLIELSLGDCIELMQSGLSRQLSDEDIGLPVLRSTNLIEGSIDLAEIKYWYLDDPQGAQTDTYFLEIDDLLVNFINSLAQIGKVALYSGELKRDAIFTTNILRLRFNKTLLPKYAFNYFNTSKYKNYIYSITKPAVNQASFTTKEFKAFLITLPATQEQQKIAAFLTAVDAKIEQLTKKEQLLQQYKKGVMQKIFSQEIRFKADDGSEFPEWQKKTLGEVVLSLSNGLSLEQNTEGSGYKVTRIETISNARINLSKVGFVETESDITNYKLNKGDMLFSNINSVQHIGKIAYVEKDFDLYHGMNLLRLVISADHDSKYLYYVLTSSWYKRYFERVCNKAVNQASINQADLRKTPLFMPSKREQTKIANFISVLDGQADKISQQLEAAKTFKKGLLQQMFV